MNHLKFVSLVFVLLLGMTLNAQNTMPEVSVKDLNGASVAIKDYVDNGKITVFSFWATWCSPCKRELDAIADYYEDWQADYNMELVAVTIDNARALPKVKPMVESKGWEYDILSDVNEDLKRSLNFQTVPMTFVVDQNGKIVYTHSGYNPGDEYELEEKLKELAGK